MKKLKDLRRLTGLAVGISGIIIFFVGFILMLNNRHDASIICFLVAISAMLVSYHWLEIVTEREKAEEYSTQIYHMMLAVDAERKFLEIFFGAAVVDEDERRKTVCDDLYKIAVSTTQACRLQTFLQRGSAEDKKMAECSIGLQITRGKERFREAREVAERVGITCLDTIAAHAEENTHWRSQCPGCFARMKVKGDRPQYFECAHCLFREDLPS